MQEIIEHLQPKAEIFSVEELEIIIGNLKTTFPNTSILWKCVLHYLSDTDQSNFFHYFKTKANDGANLDITIQTLFPKEYRKKYAINFSKLHHVSSQIQEIDNIRGKIIDPFCGSGRLLISYLGRELKEFPIVEINDVFLISTLVAYTGLLRLFRTADQDVKKIQVKVGDAFSNYSDKSYANDFNLILMNLPFTRTHNLDEKIKENLADMSFIPNKLQGQPGLHVHSLFLVTHLLKDKGQLLAILPGSTFYADYATTLRNYLLKNFVDIRLIKLTSENALSDASILNEVIFMGNKHHKPPDDDLVSFETNYLKTDKSTSQIHRRRIASRNWMKYFIDENILDLEKTIIDGFSLVSLSQLQIHITRGIELYGPDFFFFPNKHSKLDDSEEDVSVIETSSGTIYSLPKYFFQKIMRKSGNYSHSISPQVQEYCLVVDSHLSLPSELEEYVKHYSRYAKKAKDKFGESWLSHTLSQLQTKRAKSHVFMADKFGLGTVSSFVHYLDIKTASTKNFYIFPTLSGNESKFMAAWLNSTIFLLLYSINRRMIGGDYGRMQMSDLKVLPLFLSSQQYEPSQRERIIKEFDSLRTSQIPNFKLQSMYSLKSQLDHLFLEPFFDEIQRDLILVSCKSYLSRLFGSN